VVLMPVHMALAVRFFPLVQIPVLMTCITRVHVCVGQADC